MGDFMRDGESLADSGMSGVITYGPAIILDHQHPGNVSPKCGGFSPELESMSDDVDGYRCSIGVEVTLAGRRGTKQTSTRICAVPTEPLHGLLLR